MLGVRFNAATRAQLQRRATPSSGQGPEAIWHQFYDTQNYLTAATTRLQFFGVTNVDRTLSNMPAAGQLPDPQYLSIYQITCDFLTQNTSDAGAVLGQLNDQMLLQLVGRGTFTLTISDKTYGPYSLTCLHGTGGPVGGVDAGTLAVGAQWATNSLSAGWNYNGTIIIPPKVNFGIELVWGAAQATTLATLPIRISVFGILSRRVL
jgi:hypothetical protein